MIAPSAESRTIFEFPITVATLIFLIRVAMMNLHSLVVGFKRRLEKTPGGEKRTAGEKDHKGKRI